jgi:hypothetical protein
MGHDISRLVCPFCVFVNQWERCWSYPDWIIWTIVEIDQMSRWVAPAPQAFPCPSTSQAFHACSRLDPNRHGRRFEKLQTPTLTAHFLKIIWRLERSFSSHQRPTAKRIAPVYSPTVNAVHSMTEAIAIQPLFSTFRTTVQMEETSL